MKPGLWVRRKRRKEELRRASNMCARLKAYDVTWHPGALSGEVTPGGIVEWPQNLIIKNIVSLKVYRKSKVKIGSKDQKPGHEINIIQALTQGERSWLRWPSHSKAVMTSNETRELPFSDPIQPYDWMNLWSIRCNWRKTFHFLTFH